MNARYERFRERPPRRGRSALVWVTVLIWVLVIGCLAVRFIGRPMLTDYVNRQVAVAISPSIAALPSATAVPDATIRPEFQLEQSLEQVTIPVQMPAGEFVIPEADANGYLESYRGRLGPVDDVRLRFVPGRLEADITVQGISGTAYITPGIRNGRIVATEARLNQPLDMLVSIEPLTTALLERLNEEAIAQGRTITDLRIEQGVAYVRLE